jgi:hypothetical protein
MASKTLLFLGAENFHAYAWKGGALSAAQRFADSTEGKEQFAAFLRAHPHPAYLLADLIEEDFRHETVPHLRGSERAELIQRKFEQFYRNTPFRQASLLQRQKEGRRDDEMLFSALTNPSLILPWLNIMLANGIPLAGIYSVPNISGPLTWNSPSRHLLLLSWEKHAGLRQTYFDARLLRFSRLTPIVAGSSFSEQVATEAVRTQQYLKSLSLIPVGQALDVYIICHGNDRRELAVRLSDNPDIRYAYLDIQELGRGIKLKAACDDSDATPLLLHLLATRQQRGNYAAPAHTRYFQLLLVRRGLHGLGASLAAASLLWSGANIWEGRWLNSDNEALRAQAEKLTQQAQQVTQGFPGTQAAAGDMKTAVLLARKLEHYTPPPQKLLGGLGSSMDAFPRVRLDKLSWQVSGALDAAQQSGAEASHPAQVILISGELTGFAPGDYRGALDYLERFQQALAQRGYGVTALTLPLDVSPSGSITAGAGEAGGRPAQFSLKLVWRAAS